MGTSNMGKVLGIVFANMHDSTVKDLTKERTMGSVLFGGRYRMIDFPLSNFVNSGISTVGVITKYNYQSLIDHLGTGREWDLSRKKGGLILLPPFSNVESKLYRGRLEALYGVLNFIKSVHAEYVLMSDCDVVANIDYKPVLAAHIESGADITCIAHTGQYNSELIKESTVLSIDSNNRVKDVLIGSSLSGVCTLSLNMFIIKKNFLVDLVQTAIAQGRYSFERDILQSKLNELKIVAYEYSGYFKKIYSEKSYFDANMDLLNIESCKELFTPKRPIYTKVRDNAPSKYGLNSYVSNSLIADGCVIEGTVENSVLFRGVNVGKGVKVKNAILMQDTIIGDGSEVKNVITDKNVSIGNDRTLISSDDYPMFIGKGASV